MVQCGPPSSSCVVRWARAVKPASLSSCGWARRKEAPMKVKVGCSLERAGQLNQRRGLLRGHCPTGCNAMRARNGGNYLPAFLPKHCPIRGGVPTIRGAPPKLRARSRKSITKLPARLSPHFDCCGAWMLVGAFSFHRHTLTVPAWRIYYGLGVVFDVVARACATRFTGGGKTTDGALRRVFETPKFALNLRWRRVMVGSELPSC